MVGKTKRSRESSAASEIDAMRWSVERRLSFIEDRLFWLGQISRADVVRRFDVSMSQASGDIGRYVELNPKGVDYDRSAKRYVADASFRPVISKPDAHRFLGELRLVEAGLMTVEQTTAGFAPAFAATPLPERRIDAFVLRTVLQAIRGRLTVEALYQSMSRPEPVRRTLEPHALAFDGYRWHARAFDRESGQFRDFVLGRLTKTRLGSAGSISGDQDADWNAFVELEIAPHPALTEAQARAIALDYGIEKSSTTLSVRRALLFYALKRLGLDQDHTARPPSVQQIVLLNRDRLSPLISSPQT